MDYPSLWFFIYFLFGLGFLSPAQATSIIQNTILDCKSKSKVVLGKNQQIVTYRSIEHNTACDWTIPSNLATNEYAVVLLFENVTLPNLSAGCAGSLRLPKTGGYKCEFPPGYCLAYATSATLCNLERINNEALQNYTSSCESFTTWSRTQTAKIEYFASNTANIYKEFVLHYMPVYCIDPTTTTMTTTSTSNTKQTTTAKSPATQMSTTTSTTSVAKTDSTTNLNSVTLKSSTEAKAQAAAIDVSTIGLIVGATALIMLLAIGLILHRKKQSVLEFPDITARNFDNTDEMEFYEEYNGDTQQKETHTEDTKAEDSQPDDQQESSEENEVKTEYENTSYQPSEIYSAVVKKT